MTDSRPAPAPTCFIAMPITTRESDKVRYGDADHWDHVMETLFVPSLRQAGYEPIRPIADGPQMIHREIIKNLTTADLVLVDASSDNPNVFFEFGVRTALNKPVAVVSDGLSKLPFDTSVLNTHFYSSTLEGWSLDDQRERLTSYLKGAVELRSQGNQLWRHFGLEIAAEGAPAVASPNEAKLDMVLDHVAELNRRLAQFAGAAIQVRTARVSQSALDEAEMQTQAALEKVTRSFVDRVRKFGGVQSALVLEPGLAYVEFERGKLQSKIAIETLAAEVGVRVRYFGDS